MENKNIKELKNILRADFTYYIVPIVKKDKCEICESSNDLEVHHLYKFEYMLNDTLKTLNLTNKNQFIELEVNLIKNIMIGLQIRSKYMTLCESCHDNIHMKNKTIKKYNINKNKIKIENIENYKIYKKEMFSKLMLSSDLLNVKLKPEDKQFLVNKYGIIDIDIKQSNWKNFKNDLDKYSKYTTITYKNNGTYIFEKGKNIKKDNKKMMKKTNKEVMLINWIENDWDKKRITCQDVMDILDIGRKSFNILIKSENIIKYFKENRYTISTIKNKKAKYLINY